MQEKQMKVVFLFQQTQGKKLKNFFKNHLISFFLKKDLIIGIIKNFILQD